MKNKIALILCLMQSYGTFGACALLIKVPQQLFTNQASLMFHLIDRSNGDSWFGMCPLSEQQIASRKIAQHDLRMQRGTVVSIDPSHVIDLLSSQEETQRASVGISCEFDETFSVQRVLIDRASLMDYLVSKQPVSSHVDEPDDLDSLLAGFDPEQIPPRKKPSLSMKDKAYIAALMSWDRVTRAAKDLLPSSWVSDDRG